MTLSSHQASEICGAAILAARSSSVAITVSVVDAGGHLIMLSRMDGAPFGSVRFCERKAMTAAALGVATGQLEKALAKVPGLMSAAPDGMVFVDGGVPVRAGGKLVGGVGVSGGFGGQDEAIALAGLAALDGKV